MPLRLQRCIISRPRVGNGRRQSEHQGERLVMCRRPRPVAGGCCWTVTPSFPLLPSLPAQRAAFGGQDMPRWCHLSQLFPDTPDSDASQGIGFELTKDMPSPVLLACVIAGVDKGGWSARRPALQDTRPVERPRRQRSQGRRHSSCRAANVLHLLWTGACLRSTEDVQYISAQRKGSHTPFSPPPAMRQRDSSSIKCRPKTVCAFLFPGQTMRHSIWA